MSTSLASGGFPATRADRWFYALKPASWPKLVVPALFGQLLGARVTGGLDLAAFGWGFAFTAFGLAFIVLLNDWGDREVDALKRRMFPDGCSPKTIPDAILGARSVAAAGALCGLVAIALAGGAERALHRGWATEAGVACVLLFVAYTLPPVRLNYRGGGELAEMLGVGVALPLYNLYLQAGAVPVAIWPWLAGFAVLSLASAIASGLSDEQSDRLGGKRTFASTFGNRAARRLTEGLALLGILIWAAAALVGNSLVPSWAAAAAIGIAVWNLAALLRVSDQAVTNAFAAQSEYKHFLHRAIWHSTTVAAVLAWLQANLS
jgi:1,4-dihydroxy-2-naphthoate octaprenyltransferase/chlorophyll synthase